MDNSLIIELATINDLIDIFPYYEKDFPKEERKSLNHLKMLMNNHNYRLIIGKNKDNNLLVGYAFIYEIPGLNLLWLDYIAIEKSHRGKGYGSNFIKKIIENSKEKYNGIFLEIEIPDINSPEYENQLKRLKFYDQFSLSRINIDYKLPKDDGAFSIGLYYKNFNLYTPSSDDLIKTINSVFSVIHSDIANSTKIIKSMF